MSRSLRALLGSACLAAMVGSALFAASPVHAEAAQTVACASICKATVTPENAWMKVLSSSGYKTAEGGIWITVVNTSALSPPLPIVMDMTGSAPTFHVQVKDRQGVVAARSYGFYASAALNAMNPRQVLMPGQSVTFYQVISGLPEEIGAVELVRGGEAVASLATRFEDLTKAEQKVFSEGQLTRLLSSVPLPSDAERLVGRWGNFMSLERDGNLLRGTFGGSTGRMGHTIVVHASRQPSQYFARVIDKAGSELGRLWFNLQSDGALSSQKAPGSNALYGLNKWDVEFLAAKDRPAPPASPAPSPAPPPPPPPPVQEPERPLPEQPADHAAPSGPYAAWDGYFEVFGESYLDLRAASSGLTAELLEYDTERKKVVRRTPLTVDVAGSSPAGLKLLLGEHGELHQLELSRTSDGHGLAILVTGSSPSVSSGYRVAQPGALGQPRSLDAVLSQVATVWNTPHGRMALSREGEYGLKGTIVSAKGAPLYRIENSWSERDAREHDVKPDNLRITISSTSANGGGSSGQIAVTPDGQVLLVAHRDPINELTAWRATRTGASPEPAPTPSPPPSPPTPPSGSSPSTPTEPQPPSTPAPIPPVQGPPTTTPPQAPAPPPSGGSAGQVGPSGGFVNLSRTWDARFEGARIERGSEMHVTVSVKNMTMADQYPTPGSFIPRVKNADGEWLTSRDIFRASGDPVSGYRPTVPPGEQVKIRFIFRPPAKTAQLTAFSLGVFEGQTQQWDVSAAHITSLAP